MKNTKKAPIMASEKNKKASDYQESKRINPKQEMEKNPIQKKTKK